MRKFTLKQLIKSDVLQQIQDAFSDFTGMAALTTDADGVPVTKGSNFTHFCTELIRKTPDGCSQCENCDKNGALMAMKEKKPAIYRCHAGLVDFAAPIMVNDSMIGSFVAGQVFTEELDDDQCREMALKYGIDPDEYIAAAKNTIHMSREYIEKCAKLLFDISKALSSLAMCGFAEIEKSRSLEISARSQSDYIMEVFSGVADADRAVIRSARAALDSGDSEKMKESLLNLIHNGTSYTSKIRDSVTYLKTIGKMFKMCDEEYNPKKVLSAAITNIRKKLPENTTLKLEIDECVPELLLGDAGCMCHLLDKLIEISAINGGRNISLIVTSSHRCYAEVLHITILTDCQSVSGHDVNSINELISVQEEYYGSTTDDFDFSIVRSLLNAMSGNALAVSTDTGIEYRISLPKLKIKGGVE